MEDACRNPAVQYKEIWSQLPDRTNSLPAPSRFDCNMCTRTCHSWTRLRVHQCKMHGFRVPERSRIDTAWCPICLTHFGSRIRVLRHLARSANLCRPIILREFNPLDDEQVDKLDAIDRIDIALGKKCGLRDGPGAYDAASIWVKEWCGRP